MAATLKHPGLLWAGVAIVALAELVVTATILHPRVDPAYKAYYIDKSSDCWPHQTEGKYELGKELNFVGYPDDFAPNKVCGWFYPRSVGTWSYGPYSELRFRFAPTDEALQLTLNGAGMVEPAHRVQHVEVTANDQKVGEMVFDSTTPVTKQLTLPAGIGKSGLVELRFDYPDARRGDEMGLNEDPHLRAIRVLTLKLGPAGT
jgi:hypothetical protein